MVATVVVNEMTGSGPTYTAITNRVRLFSDDVATNQSTAQTTNPIVIPSADFNYSYWKHVCLDLQGSGFTITNVRHYSNADVTATWHMGTSGMLQRGNRDAGDHGCPVANYTQASGTAGTTGNPIETTHPYYSGQTVKVADVNSDIAPNGATIDSTSHTSAEKTKSVVLQCKIAPNATQGTQTAVTLTWKYDES
jgi:hypothetical protein